MIYVIVIMICGNPDLVIYHNKEDINVIPYTKIIKSDLLSNQLINNLNHAIKNNIYFEIKDRRGKCV